MRLPRFRLKLWMLALLVALVGVGFGVERTIRRARYARERAAYYARLETDARFNLSMVEMLHGGLESVEREDHWWRETGLLRAKQEVEDRWGKAGSLRDRIATCARMRRRLEHASRYPWLPVAPVPPEPE